MAVAMVNDPLENAITCLQLNRGDTIDLTGGKTQYVDDSDITTLMESWQENTSVTSLDLSINHIGDQGAIAIAKALYEHGEGNLKNLELDSNRVGSEGCVTLFKHLPPSLTRLDLSGNLFQDDAVMEGMQALSSGVAPNLQSLILRDNVNLGNEAFKAIGKWLENPKCNLSILHISGNSGFTDSGMISFCASLKSNRSLVDLNLSNTGVSEFKDLVEALKDNEEIRAVVLAHDGARFNVPELDAILQRNKKIAIRRRSEIALLKDAHAKEMQQQREDYESKIRALESKVADLENQVREQTARADAAEQRASEAQSQQPAAAESTTEAQPEQQEEQTAATENEAQQPEAQETTPAPAEEPVAQPEEATSAAPPEEERVAPE